MLTTSLSAYKPSHRRFRDSISELINDLRKHTVKAKKASCTDDIHVLADEIELMEKIMMFQSPLLFMLTCEMAEDWNDWYE